MLMILASNLRSWNLAHGAQEVSNDADYRGWIAWDGTSVLQDEQFTVEDLGIDRFAEAENAPSDPHATCNLSCCNNAVALESAVPASTYTRNLRTMKSSRLPERIVESTGAQVLLQRT